MEAVVFKTKRGEDDIFAFYKEINGKRLIVSLVITCAGLLVFLAFCVYVLLRYGALDNICLFMALVFLLLLVRDAMLPSRWRKIIRKQVEKNGEHEITYTFCEDRFIYDYVGRLASGHEERSYASIEKAVEKKDRLFIYTSASMVHVIKKADIPVETLPLIRRMICSKLPQDKYKIKG